MSGSDSRKTTPAPPAAAGAIDGLDVRRFLHSRTWDRTSLTSILTDATTAQNAGDPARFHARQFSDPGTVTFVTGQQPAVGGGPLYTLVKIAHAIALARTASTAAHACVPLFWCASEDHDLGEAGHTDLILRNGDIRRFHANLGDGRASLRFRAASIWWDALMDYCRTHLGAGAGSTWLEAHQPTADEGLGAWQCRFLAALFSEHGLVCVEGHLLRPLWTTHLQLALDRWPTAALTTTRARLLADGTDDAFGELPHAPLFADHATGRLALSPVAAQILLTSDPTALSPGAALRPILQQAALPAAVYVGGPGEVNYHAFIHPLYAALDVPAPTLVPRCSLSLVPAWIERGLARWQRSLDQITEAPPTRDPSTSLPALAALSDALSLLEREQTTADTHVRTQLAGGVTRLRRAQRRLIDSLARADRRLAERPAWGALTANLLPRGRRQERTLSLFQALWEHGPGLANRLVEAAAATPPGVHAYVNMR